MDLNEAVLVCKANLEWLNSQGVPMKKVFYKLCTLRLIRNDLREIYCEITQEKMTTTKLKMKNINVFKKFMADGKASIKFNNDNCNLYLSNCPPTSLMVFLKNLYIKMVNDDAENKELTKDELRNKINAHILAEKPNKFDDISPVTNLELARAKKQTLPKSSLTTPSPPANKKRKLSEINRKDGNQSQPLAAKKLYAPNVSSPLAQKLEKVERPNDPAFLFQLNDEQNQVLQACLKGRNIFFCGSAGTGKSYLLRKIISVLPPEETFSTASTGVAACLIGGVTLHSFAGIGSGEYGLKRCVEMASRNSVTWKKCKRLIIDEVSMVDGEFFDKIEHVAREIRRNDRPFGGIQLILCGDFFQLPPVVKKDKGLLPTANAQQNKKYFCFQSESWSKCIDIQFELKQVHRQKDQKFIEILNNIRIGRVTEQMTETLLSTSKQKIEANGIVATQLCCMNNEADSINKSKMDNLKTPEKVFEAVDSDSYLSKILETQLPVPLKLTLKIGCQVMLLKNINVSNGLVNGARGVVTAFKEGFPLVKFKSKLEYIAKPEKWIIKTSTGTNFCRRQVPLKLGWAFSIHKSQGLTLDCVEMSLSKVFEAGQAYVALSRCQSLDSLRILDFDAKQVWANPDVLRFYKTFRRNVTDTTFYALGVDKKKELKRQNSGLKLTKSLMSKPLVNIC